MCGSKHATSSSKVTIPPEVLARYNAVNKRAEAAAASPFEKYGTSPTDFVAQMNAQQNAGINTINTSGGPAYEGIERYMSPYIKNVADTTGAMMRQQQEQAQSGALGTAISSGAFGGDRAGIAAANLQQQNQMGYGKTMADIYNQGYTQALGASQADLARKMQAGQMQLAAGTMEQQTEQAGKDAMIKQFMQEKGYPFQIAQFLANIAMGTGALSGSTTTSKQPVGFFGNLATGGRVDGYAEGGGVSGPMSDSQGSMWDEGYVPGGVLPVGQLMTAEVPSQEKSDTGDNMMKLATMAMGGAKRGGAIDARHGYATDGSVEDETYGEMISRLSYPLRYAVTDRLPNAALALGSRALGATQGAAGVAAGVAGYPEAADYALGAAANSVQRANAFSRRADAPAPVAASASDLRPTAEQIAARSALGENRMTMAPPRFAGDTNDRLRPTPSAGLGLDTEYGRMLRDPASALPPFQWTEEPNADDADIPVPGYAAKTLSFGSGRPDVPTGVLPAAPQRVYGRPDVPVGSLPAAPPTMFNTPVGSLPASNALRDRMMALEPVGTGLSIPTQADLDRSAQSRAAGEALKQDEFFRRQDQAADQAERTGTPAYTGVVAPATARPTVATGLSLPIGDAGQYVLGTSGAPAAAPAPAPAADQAGVAGPAQVGTYTGVAGAGKGFTDLIRPDGTVEHRTGAPSWRNNNPGNVEYGDFAKAHGAIGTDGRFAVFPDAQTGLNASKDLLFNSDAYRGMTIAQALTKYSPPSENPTAEKIAAITSEIGLPADTPMSQMTPQQKDAFMLALQRTEGPMDGSSAPYRSAPTGVAGAAAGTAAPSGQMSGLGGADMMQGRGGSDPFHVNKPYEERNVIGKFFHDPVTGKLNKNAVMSVLAGLGAMANSNSLSPITALLQGVAGGSDAYKQLERQASDIALQQAQARKQGILTPSETGGPALDVSNGQVTPLLGEVGANGVTMPYQVPKGMETIVSSPAFQQALQLDGIGVSAASSPQAAASVDNFNAVQSEYASAKGTFTPMMSSFGAASNLIANGGVTGSGPAADMRAKVIAAANMILSSIPGIGPVNFSDMDSAKAIIDKTAAAAAQAGQGSSPSVLALQNALDTQGNANLPPEALASITAQNLVDRQMAIDKGEFYRTYQQSQGIKSQYGQSTYIGAEGAFSDTVGQKYNAEKAYLEYIMLAPDGVPERVKLRDHLIHLSSGAAGPGYTPEAVQAAIKEAYPNAPDDLWKVFFNKGLTE